MKNDEEIDYAYNQDKSNVIIQNNRLLVGTVEKIKNDLLNLETQQIQENPEDKEEDVEDKEDEEEFDDEEEELD